MFACFLISTQSAFANNVTHCWLLSLKKKGLEASLEEQALAARSTEAVLGPVQGLDHTGHKL